MKPTEEMQKKYMQFQQMNTSLQEGQEQLTKIESQMQELLGAKQGLEGLEDVQQNDEILVPITNGMFIKATITQTDPVLVNVGADTVIDKKRTDALTLLETQWEQLVQAHAQLNNAVKNLQAQAKQAEAELDKLVKAQNV